MGPAARQSRGMAPPLRKRKAVNEEITFDRTARQEYLTGFHKRKLQRIKLAQEEALKREKEERIQDRKKLRESRKEEIETHVKQVKALARKAAAQANGDPFDSESEGDWAGIDEENSDDDSEEEAAETAAEKLNKQEEYIDEDKFTTVTVEAMDFDAAEEIDSETERKNAAKREEAEKAEKEKKKRKPKEKKKKFRYLTKTERKADRVKLRTKMAKRREKFKEADSAKPKSTSKGKKK